MAGSDRAIMARCRAIAARCRAIAASDTVIAALVDAMATKARTYDESTKKTIDRTFLIKKLPRIASGDLDPIHLVWMVNEISRLAISSRTRPDPIRLVRMVNEILRLPRSAALRSVICFTFR